MTREELDSLDKETLIRLVLAQAKAIAALTRECEALRARLAELETKLGLPAKTPLLIPGEAVHQNEMMPPPVTD